MATACNHGGLQDSRKLGDARLQDIKTTTIDDSISLSSASQSDPNREETSGITAGIAAAFLPQSSQPQVPWADNADSQPADAFSSMSTSTTALGVKGEGHRRQPAERDRAAIQNEERTESGHRQSKAGRQCTNGTINESDRVTEHEEMPQNLDISGEFQAAKTYIDIVGGAIVTFSAGLEVSDIVTGFECCKIIVKNVPSDCHPEEFDSLLIQQGLDQTQFHVVDQQPERQEATVVVHSNIATNVFAKPIFLRGQRLKFNLGLFNGIGGMDSPNPDAGAKLHVTFFAPSARFLAVYADAPTAVVMSRELDGRQIQGRTIRVFLGQMDRTIVLDNLPAKYAECTDDIKELARTQHLKTLPSTFVDVGDAIRTIGIACNSLAPVAVKAISCDEDTADVALIEVTCKSWEDAATLNHTLLLSGKFTTPVSHDRTKMWTELLEPDLYTVTIPSAQYEAQSTIWNGLVEIGESTTAGHLEIKDTLDGYHRIQVTGADRLAIGAMKVRVERLAEGVTVPGWDPALAYPSKDLLASIAAVGAHLQVDSKKELLKLYGTPVAIEAAEILLEEALDSLHSSVAQTAIVPPSALHFFSEHGVQELQDIFGQDNVVFESTECSITVDAVSGGEDFHDVVQHLIHQAEETGAYTATQQVCQICLDKPIAPRTFLCSHVYCTSCLRHFFSCADSAPLLCLGDEGHCRTPFPLFAIREFLAPADWHRLLEMAVHAYVGKRPQEFRPCATPDCRQIYRRQARPVTLSCPGCFSQICAACGEGRHDGMKCEEYTAMNDKEEQERLTETWLLGERETKRCPQCSVLINRIEGCNHMQCRCGAHLCWRCLAVFQDSKETYVHMRSTHGGIYDEDMDVGPRRGARRNPRYHQNAYLLAGERPRRFHRVEREDELRLQREMEQEFERLGLVAHGTDIHAEAERQRLIDRTRRRAQRLLADMEIRRYQAEDGERRPTRLEAWLEEQQRDINLEEERLETERRQRTHLRNYTAVQQARWRQARRQGRRGESCTVM
ncbi:hypothetical protein CYLTODRAFT_450103 [Cylindrobasidium torrendii FP15055 ss-10]|uniref:RBR-type E3 ubiquitin transferase n=1 Tax=Cylindrobasidium torrendii FP15055 ss-10 TaxID=1314674 RepID=A0A0D7BNR4_9AGAR|nr:hypothetical protein CYLTODRAFT_450103 [Cylindrobasidium torrendii FP15055 ss-10]